jgi:peptidoglycan/LPS O-acetylase OafA/YrhL
MIQRIQSVYLLLGALVLASSYLLSNVWTGPAAVSSAWFTPLTLGLFSLTIAVGIASVLMYSHRDRQLVAVLAVMIFAVAGLIVLGAGMYIGGTFPGIESTETGLIQPSLALLIPLVSIAFFGLARRGIKKDIKLLKSVDRLR